METAIAAVAGVVVGAVLAWLFLRGRSSAREAAAVARARELEESRAALERERAELGEKYAGLMKEYGRLERRDEEAAEAEKKLRETFEALAGEALKSNAEEFLKRAHDRLGVLVERMKGGLEKHKEQVSGLVGPLKEALDRMEADVRELEKKREGAYTDLKGRLDRLLKSEEELRRATGSLEGALKTSPGARGRWGEMQLRRLVELAGMSRNVDFTEQTAGGDGDRGRPDMVIRMPNGGVLPVDAKVTLGAYFEAQDESDPARRKAKLEKHARDLWERIKELGRREYWRQFDESTELVVMFVPMEASVAAAFEYRRGLFEEALERRILIATPVTLFALLRAFAYGWMQVQLAENAGKIVKDAGELYGRLKTFRRHMENIPKALDRARDAYEAARRSFEQRLMPAARRYEELSGGEMETPAVPDGKDSFGGAEDVSS